jgi:hypothetical protein
VNQEWYQSFQNSNPTFQAQGISDHSPIIISLDKPLPKAPKPFKFYNHWVDHPTFLDIVRKEWNCAIKGNPMFILIQKLKKKRLKARLKTWSKQTYGVTAIKLEEIRGRFSLVQTELDKDPSDLRLQSMEKKDLLDLLNHTLSIEEAELRQKSPPHVRGLCDPFVKVRESPLGILGTLLILIKAHLISGLTLGFIAMFYGIYYQIELFLQT